MLYIRRSVSSLSYLRRARTLSSVARCHSVSHGARPVAYGRTLERVSLQNAAGHAQRIDSCEWETLAIVQFSNVEPVLTVFTVCTAHINLSQFTGGPQSNGRHEKKITFYPQNCYSSNCSKLLLLVVGVEGEGANPFST